MHEGPVDAFAVHEIVVGSLLHGPALVEHENPVGPYDARKTVRQHQGRAVLHQVEERLLDDRLVFRIHGRERFVEHQDRRIAQERAGDRDPLALAAGKPDAALAHHGPVSRRQPGDEVVGVGQPAGFLHLFLAGIGLAEPEIILDGAVKQVGVLG